MSCYSSDSHSILYAQRCWCTLAMFEEEKKMWGKPTKAEKSAWATELFVTSRQQRCRWFQRRRRRSDLTRHCCQYLYRWMENMIMCVCESKNVRWTNIEEEKNGTQNDHTNIERREKLSNDHKCTDVWCVFRCWKIGIHFHWRKLVRPHTKCIDLQRKDFDFGVPKLHRHIRSAVCRWRVARRNAIGSYTNVWILMQ